MNARTERRSATETECYDNLRAELLDALTDDPQRIVKTPAFGKRIHYTAAQVLLDSLQGTAKANEVDPLHLLIGILADAARGEDVQLRATLFMDIETRKHAAWHCADMAVEVEEGAEVV